MEKTDAFFGQEVAICCDIETDLYLVPKQWVKECIMRDFAEFTYNFVLMALSKMKEMKHNPNAP